MAQSLSCGGRTLSSQTGGTDASAESTSLSAPTPLDASTDSSSDGAADATPDAGPLLDPTPCLTGGNVLYMEHDFTSFTSGPVTLTPPSSTFSGKLSPSSDPTWMGIEAFLSSKVNFAVVVTGEYDDGGLPVTPLHLGTYTEATPAGESIPGHATLVINAGTFTDCGDTSSSFEILAMTATDATIEDVTIAFDYECVGEPLRGCVHAENIPNGNQ